MLKTYRYHDVVDLVCAIVRPNPVASAVQRLHGKHLSIVLDGELESLGVLLKVGDDPVARHDYVVSIEHEDRAFEKTEKLVKRGFLVARSVLKPYIK